MSKNVSGSALVYGDARVYGSALVYDNACVYGSARVYEDACVYGNALVYGDSCVYGNAHFYGNAHVYGNALVYGDSCVYGSARVYGNARVYGDADIQSNNDWFSFIYSGKTLTGYRSRNEQGYELNINAESVQLEDLDVVITDLVKYLIGEFTPFENKNNKRIELEKVISDLNEQLEIAKNKLKNL